MRWPKRLSVALFTWLCALCCLWGTDKDRNYAETQLAHVREQMGTIIAPMPSLLGVSNIHKVNLDIELGLPSGQHASKAAGGPIRPLVLPRYDLLVYDLLVYDLLHVTGGRHVHTVRFKFRSPLFTIGDHKIWKCRLGA